MDFLEMVPNDDEQIVVIGQNGRGKSAWLKKIISPYYEKRQIIIIDDKADDIWDGFGEIVHTVDGLYKKADKFEANPVVIFRPEGALAEDFDAHVSIHSREESRETPLYSTIIALQHPNVPSARTATRNSRTCTRFSFQHASTPIYAIHREPPRTSSGTWGSR